MRLHVSAFVSIRCTCELVFINRIRRVYETFFSVLDLSSIFKSISSYFQLRNFYRRCIARNFGFNWFINMRLHVATFVHIRHTSELIVTYRVRRVYETFFRVFDIGSVFSLITSHFQLRNIDLRRITRYFSYNLRVDVRLNVVSFVHVRHTCKLIVTDRVRRIYEAFFSIFNFRSIFERITSCFQFRNIDLWRITRNLSYNLSIDMRLDITSFIRFSCSCKLIVTNNLRCIFKTCDI